MTTSASHWDVDALAWDTAYLDDVAVPGRSRIKGSIRADIEEKKAKGADKATTSYLGRKATRFRLETHLTAPEWPAYAAAVLGLVNSKKPGQGQETILVDHPALQGLGIGRCLVAEVSLPEVRDDRTMMMAIDFVENIPKPPPVKPAGGRSRAPDLDARAEAQDQQLAALEEETQRFVEYNPFASDDEIAAFEASQEAQRQQIEGS